MTPIHVVGIGLDGANGLAPAVRQLVEQATILVGSIRHLSYFPDHPGDRLILGNFRVAIEKIAAHLKLTTSAAPELPSASSQASPSPQIVILTSGDPLFFGLGRLLLAELPAEQLTFHPHLSSIQLAFNRVKLPWQDARLISAHGRSLDELTQALQQNADKIAVLTDGTHTPQAIARLLKTLDLADQYQLWVCENLGSSEEQVQKFQPLELMDTDTPQTFASLNVVILSRVAAAPIATHPGALPAFGLLDSHFFSFPDRPGLMTKREIRILVLGELAIQAGQTIWDIGAGTGSISVELARLLPDAAIWAIEKTAVGISLIQQNCQRFQVDNVTAIHGSAPSALQSLPCPDRIFIGGSGGNLTEILDFCAQRLQPQGLMVLALATLEHLTETLNWLKAEAQLADHWQHRLLNVQISRSVAVGPLTRLTPLNPVTLITCSKRLL
jgi:precorrin-6B C5,15-methyltransferase / cobalt-precorrin-6B C5,C15-methyltransferase